ncbi:hypothetical protein, partial [Klebsiella pneumoniae]|uniref:hypothetical protein n=1 Tax=Klebsiella pneumoniae TaxID=573 RepID=UPI003EE2E13A
AKITFTAWRNGKKQTFSQDGNVSALEFVYATGWNRAELAAHVLHRIDTKESRAALERLASGHEQAKLTRTAAGLSKAKPAAE